MYMSYNCQYSLFNLLCIFSYIVNVIYGTSYVVTNAPGTRQFLADDNDNDNDNDNEIHLFKPNFIYTIDNKYCR